MPLLTIGCLLSPACLTASLPPARRWAAGVPQRLQLPPAPRAQQRARCVVAVLFGLVLFSSFVRTAWYRAAGVSHTARFVSFRVGRAVVVCVSAAAPLGNKDTQGFTFRVNANGVTAAGTVRALRLISLSSRLPAEHYFSPQDVFRLPAGLEVISISGWYGSRTRTPLMPSPRSLIAYSLVIWHASPRAVPSRC